MFSGRWSLGEGCAALGLGKSVSRGVGRPIRRAGVGEQEKGWQVVRERADGGSVMSLRSSTLEPASFSFKLQAHYGRLFQSLLERLVGLEKELRGGAIMHAKSLC